MGRLGVAFSGGLDAAEIVECAVLAESLGYDSVWMAEGHGGDQFAVLAAVAVRTHRVALGTCISSVFVRSAPTIAMAAATVDRLSGGRFILGLGSSHRVQVGPEHGLPYGKPVTRVRETVEVVPPPAARRPRVLSGRDRRHRALRSLVHAVPPPPARLSRGRLPQDDRGLRRDRGRRDPDQDDPRERRGGEEAHRRRRGRRRARAGRGRPGVAASRRGGGRPGRRVRRPAARRRDVHGLLPALQPDGGGAGFGEEAAVVAEAWARGDRAAAAAAVSDALIDSVCVAGTPRRCRDRIDAYRESGIDLPLIAPVAEGPDAKAQTEATIRACAPG